MKSRTSFFNTTVLRKDITRYAPVWGLYTIGLLLFMLTPCLGEASGEVADYLGSTNFAVINLIYGGICALMVFGDLFKARLCYATHAMPLRRETWFLTHFTAGLLFSLVPNLLICLIFLPILQSYWYMGLLWLAITMLQYMFFFGSGAFCAVCAGNRLGAAAAYAILHFGILLINWYAEEIYTPLLYGVEYRGTFVDLLMPASHLVNLDFVSYTRRPFLFAGIIPGDWLYLGIIAAVGVLLTILAVAIYRKRNLESAGDFLSLPAAKPVFLLVYTLAVGYLVSNLISQELLGMFMGLIIGFFTGKMLLERTVKVFRGWNFLQLGILVTVLAVSIGLTALDPLGVTRYVPDTDDVEVMYFCGSSDSHLYLYENPEGRVIQEPAEIDQFRQFHEDVADGRYRQTNDEPSDVTTVITYLRYELKNGRTVMRRYEIPVDSTHGEFVRSELSRWESAFHINDWDAFASRIEQVDLEIRFVENIGHFTLTDRAQIQGLLEAVKADCEAGNMAQNWTFHQEEESAAWLYIYDDNFKVTNSEYLGSNPIVYSLNLNIYDSCEHTLAYIESLNLDYSPYEK